MRLRVTLVVGSERDDVAVTTDSLATVGGLSEHVRRSHPRVALPDSGPLGFAVNPGTPLERFVGPDTSLADAGIRSGDLISVTRTSASGSSPRPAVATLTVVAGPDAPATFALHRGTNYVGRDRECDVRLSDPLVSKRHARISVSDMVEIIDDASANGILISHQVVERAVLRPGDVAALGDTVVSVTLHSTRAAPDGSTAHKVEFNRSPRLDPQYVGLEMDAPEPPQLLRSLRFPVVTLIAPILMAGMIYAITRNAISILFVALSPMMLVGAYFENRIAGKRALEHETTRFRTALADLVGHLQYAANLERMARRHEHPSSSEVVEAVTQLTPLVWTRRPEHDAFLCVRLGLGVQSSRNSVKMPMSNNSTPELWKELTGAVEQFATIDLVPVVAELREAGNIGVAGPDTAAAGLMRGILAQLVGLHSPSEVVVAGIGPSARSDWEWMKWLPHVGSEFSPLTCEHLASNSTEAAVLVAAIEELIADRTSNTTADERRLPAVVVWIHDDAPVDRARLVQLAERGPAVGVHVVWYAASTQRLPAACRAFLEVDPNSGIGRAGFVKSGAEYTRLELEPIDQATVARFARRLAPVTDSGAKIDDASDLPRSVSFVALSGIELVESVPAVIERWRVNNSLPFDGRAPARNRDNTLRALVGQGAAGPIYLDLRAQGPHALVGGITGSGKSEFLQSWILGMATMHSPARVTFLLVDYKGGAAFAECVDLPHCVGLVTDLSPHMLRRALTSLKSELRHREQLLHRKNSKDLLELERRGDADTPPSLVVVVDEFAALVSEVPAFADDVVDVAQRGRSLGLHLILATQRPSGVIRDNLRANTNLRVALRVADDNDSVDVIGTAHAATFDPAVPGRGAAKMGPGRLTSFQSAFVGGHTSAEPEPSIEIHTLRFGVGERWQAADDGDPDLLEPGASDIHRIVDVVKAAASELALPAPRRPWLPVLAATYRLEDLPSGRTDRELVFGVGDDPAAQSQPPVAFWPDRDGNMTVYGTGGSGKSTFLRTIAAAAAFGPARGGPCWVYGIDFGSRGLQMLERLPHVGGVIPGEDHERVVRLLRYLKGLIAQRATAFASAEASTIDEFRERTGRRDEARVIVLVDGVGAFRQAYEGGEPNRWWELFQSIAADGRGVGVHVVMSADRPGAVSSGLASTVQRRLVLRLANEMDYALLEISSEPFGLTSPPGRGFVDGTEVQVGVFGGESSISAQATAFSKLARSMERHEVSSAPPIHSLADRIAWSDLPPVVDGRPVLGVWDETLMPIGFEATGTFVVAGAPQSGRTTTVATLVRSLRAMRSDAEFVLFGQRRSPLRQLDGWSITAVSPIEIEAAAKELIDRVAVPGGHEIVVVIEAIGELLNTEADIPAQDLLKLCRANEAFVIAEGETSSLTGSWPLLSAVKSSRSGIVLQPDQIDGDALFKTSFSRTTRAEYPPGRGLLVHRGRTYRVQVALPE